ncbi:MAG: hypothetical protein H6737_18405 [Alphaproteobacteria bacterium]|nr:hypothetical protein [Alphaproteobacteria bacterium]
MKAWSALRHRLGEATDLPDLIEKARHPDPEVRKHARYGLAERLIGRGSWPSAAPRAVSELVVDAVFPDTPDRAGLVELLARIAGADAPRVLFKPLDPTDASGRGVLEALDTRSPEIEELTTHEDPNLRVHAMRLVSLAVPAAALPETDDDPDVEAALAIARARRGEPMSPKSERALSIHEAFDHRQVNESALADVLGWTPDPRKFPWAGSDIDAFVRKLLSIKHDDRLLCATVFSIAVERFPDHPRYFERVQIVGAEGFPVAVESLEELSIDQETWLKRCLARPLPRNTLQVAGIPERYEDARRFLGLDPPGLLETTTPEGPVWQVIERDEDGERLKALPLSLGDKVRLAGLTVFRPYWIEPIAPDALAALAGELPVDEAAAWATAFLAQLESIPHDERPWESHRHPAHANVALLQLHRAKKPVPAASIAFEDSATRVGAVLSALGPEQRSAALRAHIEDPDREDFQEARILAEVLPHLAADASLAEPVLRCLAGLLQQVHHGDEDKEIVRGALAWAEKHDAARTAAWREQLSDEESERLGDALGG